MKIKKWRWFLAVAAALAGLIFFQFSRDNMAQFAWHDLESPGLALALVRSDPGLAMELGLYYFNGGVYELDNAQKAFKKALKIDPRLPLGNYHLARVYFANGRGAGRKALKTINKEIKINPENVRAYYVRGVIRGYGVTLGYTDNYTGAIEDFAHFVEWNPMHWAGHNDLIWVLSAKGDYQEAKEAALRSFEVVPEAETNPWLWNGLGLAQLNIEEYKDAEISFKKAYELAKELAEGDWRRAYPGNNPANDRSSIKLFVRAIAENLRVSVIHK